MHIVPYLPTNLCPVPNCKTLLKNHKTLKVTKCCLQILGATCGPSDTQECILCHKTIDNLSLKPFRLPLYQLVERTNEPPLTFHCNLLERLSQVEMTSLQTFTALCIGLFQTLLNQVVPNVISNKTNFILKGVISLSHLYSLSLCYMAFKPFFKMEYFSFAPWDATNQKTQLLWLGSLSLFDIGAMAATQVASFGLKANSPSEKTALAIQTLLGLQHIYYYLRSMEPQYLQAWAITESDMQTVKKITSG